MTIYGKYSDPRIGAVQLLYGSNISIVRSILGCFLGLWLAEYHDSAPILVWFGLVWFGSVETHKHNLTLLLMGWQVVARP